MVPSAHGRRIVWYSFRVRSFYLYSNLRVFDVSSRRITFTIGLLLLLLSSVFIHVDAQVPSAVTGPARKKYDEKMGEFMLYIESFLA